MLAIAGSSIGLYADSFAALGDDERVPVELQSLLQQFAGSYALAVTPPSGAGGDDVIGGVFFIAGLVPDANVDEFQSATETIAADAEGWQQQTFVDNDLLVINAVPASVDLEALPQDLLASDRMYQWVRARFSQNGTNVYVNVEAVQVAFERQLSEVDELAALSPIRGLGIAAQTEGQGDVHARIHVLLAARQAD
jgi:hypothetical protein